MRMKLAAALAVAVTLSLPASTGASGQRVLGIDTTVLGMRLAWYDPATLTRLPGRTVPLVNHEGPWSVSPGGLRLALAGRSGDVRIIDVKRMRTLGVVPIRLKEPASSASWLPRARLLVTAGTSVAVVDTQGLRLLRRAKLPGVVDGSAIVNPLGVALLLTPATNGFAPAKVAVVADDGHVRVANLDRISIGFHEASDTYDVRRPGFAVDPATARAFVVGVDDTIAEVNLRTLAVTYHGGSSHWLAKALPGPQRNARWLGNGLLAVAGNTGTIPSGLRIVDTRGWTTRVVDRSSEDVVFGAGTVVGELGPSVTAYSTDGTQRYRLTLVNGEDLEVARRYGYVCHGMTLEAVLDLSTGAQVGSVHGPTCVDVLAR